MQGYYELKLCADEQAVLNLGIVKERTALLNRLIDQYADQLAYMLQVYYSREKVSRVTVVPDSIAAENPQSVKLMVIYVMEEYNACSAVNTEVKTKMNLTAAVDDETGLLNIKGEYWPQLDD